MCLEQEKEFILNLFLSVPSIQLGGAVVPYPNTCRLPDAIPANDEFVPYEDSDIFDYPSVGQIAQALRDQDIIPIFAATNDVQPIYEVKRWWEGWREEFLGGAT